jgi:hypothetical protein
MASLSGNLIQIGPEIVDRPGIKRKPALAASLHTVNNPRVFQRPQVLGDRLPDKCTSFR